MGAPNEPPQTGPEAMSMTRWSFADLLLRRLLPKRRMQPRTRGRTPREAPGSVRCSWARSRGARAGRSVSIGRGWATGPLSPFSGVSWSPVTRALLHKGHPPSVDAGTGRAMGPGRDSTFAGSQPRTVCNVMPHAIFLAEMGEMWGTLARRASFVTRAPPVDCCR